MENSAATFGAPSIYKIFGGVGVSWGIVCSRWRSLWKIAWPLLVHLTYKSSFVGGRVWGGGSVWGELGASWQSWRGLI